MRHWTLMWERPQPLLRTWLRLRGVQQQQPHSASPTLSLRPVKRPPQLLRTPQPGLTEGHHRPPRCTRWCGRCVRLSGRPGATACSSIFRATWQPWALRPSRCMQALNHLRYIVISIPSLILTPLYVCHPSTPKIPSGVNSDIFHNFTSFRLTRPG